MDSDRSRSDRGQSINLKPNNMQKQNRKKVLLCTFRDCKNPQDDEGEFCPKHYPKKGRKDLRAALNRLDKLAELGSTTLKEKKQQEKDYNKLFDFIIYS